MSQAPVTREKIAGEVGSGHWALLAPHAERDALILIDPQLDLVDAALAIARDESTQVQAWIANALLGKPSSADQARFADGPKTYFRFVVIHPFVVASEIVMDAVTVH